MTTQSMGIGKLSNPASAHDFGSQYNAEQPIPRAETSDALPQMVCVTLRSGQNAVHMSACFMHASALYLVQCMQYTALGTQCLQYSGVSVDACCGGTRSPLLDCQNVVWFSVGSIVCVEPVFAAQRYTTVLMLVVVAP